MAEQHASEVLGSYEHLIRVTSRMREAAVHDDWDTVVALESECAGLYARLMQAPERESGSPEYQRRKSELICKLLEDDAQIRERLNGELVRIWQLIDGKGQLSKLASAYGGRQ